MAGTTEEDRRLLRALWNRAYLPNLLFATGQGAILPVLALAARHLGAPGAIAALVVSLNGIGTMLMDLPAGQVIARLGERRSALVATLLLLTGLSACFLATDVVVLGAGIFVQATGWSIWSLVRLTNISRISSGTSRGRAISIFGGVSRAGQVIGPFLVAGLGSGGSERASFAIYFICAAVGWVWLEMARDRKDVGLSMPTPVAFHPVAIVRAHRAEFATAGVTSYTLGILRSSRQVVLPLWGAHIGLSVAQVSFVYGVSALLDVSLFYPAGLLSDRFGRRAVAIPCLGLLAFGHVLLPMSHTEVTLLMVGLVLGFGNGLGAGIVMTLGADRAPEVGRPAFLALWRLVSDAGTSSGPIVDGVLIGLVTLSAATPIVGAIGFGATMYTWRFLRESHGQVRVERPLGRAGGP